MATYTANYGLHQWVAEDNFQRTDFNTDLSKIDAGLKTAQDTADGAASAASAAQSAADAAQSTADSKISLMTGSYTGNDAESRSISLGFQPKAVLVERQNGIRYSNAPVAGLALYGKPCYSSTSNGGLTITSNGFTVASSGSAKFNDSEIVYYYMAFR